MKQNKNNEEKLSVLPAFSGTWVRGRISFLHCYSTRVQFFNVPSFCPLIFTFL